MMTKQTGDPAFPLWLLGDSDPDRWRKHLAYPFDSRHPIRHNVWTSVIDVVQDKVYRALMRRVDARRLFVRNAVQNPVAKPSAPFNALSIWPAEAQTSLDDYRKLLAEHRPKIIIPFGWFAFAFALRAVGEPCDGPSCNGSQSGHLGNEFRKRAAGFEIEKANVLPLLHRSIAGGNFLSGHNEFCGKPGGNYLEEAGQVIADILIRYRTDIRCWIDMPASLQAQAEI